MKTSRTEASRKAAAAARARQVEKEAAAERKRRKRRRLLAGAAIAGIGIAGLSTYEMWRRSSMSQEPDPLAPGSYPFRYFIGAQQGHSWYRRLEGQPVSVSDFPVNEGAIARWEGMPVLKPVSILFLDPIKPHVVPNGSSGTTTRTGVDIPDDLRVVRHAGGVFIAFYSGCTHACCVLGYHEAYRTLDVYHCTCHNARYDPWTVVKRKDEAGRYYTGALNIQLPATRPLPYVPLELVGDRLHGILTEENREWYRYCGVKKDGR